MRIYLLYATRRLWTVLSVILGEWNLNVAGVSRLLMALLTLKCEAWMFVTAALSWERDNWGLTICGVTTAPQGRGDPPKWALLNTGADGFMILGWWLYFNRAWQERQRARDEAECEITLQPVRYQVLGIADNDLIRNAVCVSRRYRKIPNIDVVREDWVVTWFGSVLSKDSGYFILEHQPEMSVEEFIADTRFKSPEEALAGLVVALEGKRGKEALAILVGQIIGGKKNEARTPYA